MKKQLGLMIAIGTLIGSIIAGCNGCKNKPGKGTGDEDDTTGIDISERHDTLPVTPLPPQTFQITEQNKDSVLAGTTKEILTIFKNKDYNKLDSFIHPQEGIRFSPYATVEPGTDKKFSREAFNALITTQKNKKINWGNYDGSGNAIKLTPEEYFNKFVYDGNFMNAKKTGVNTTIGKGNNVNNVKAVYSGSDFTENYLDGTKKSGGINWKSVRLVYKLVNGKYYLVGIVHDQWTI